MPETERSILIPKGEIKEVPNAFGYPIEVWNCTIEKKRGESKDCDGVFLAAELMLGQAAVVVEFVNKDDPGEPIREGEKTFYKRPSLLLGFNDRGGGSESDYKILLNCFDEENPGTYVLFSPPNEEGLPSNLTFHLADFTFLTFESSNTRDDIPNSLKTYEVATQMDRSFFEYYLVGNEDTPHRFLEVFKTAGFNFVPEPFGDDELGPLYRHEFLANQTKIYPGVQR
ncbi:MAG: hypothetical protein CO135_02675 [Candidatus Levybacteria bacterium CG_4_9_14_3_um_filter_35_16]|nr:MAG: hypothetical protein CO135_02675 [Candidatus Levybacteria bacterium CG_4_9_14_3_um_filter_35_16]PJC54044.1 MAG: hypothetical protein CO028_04505 [Candidatus Levybacteria bacterium CG_4_9_14_0_2_um_filter_35_21]